MISSRIASPSVTTRSALVMQCVSSARVRTVAVGLSLRSRSPACRDSQVSSQNPRTS